MTPASRTINPLHFEDLDPNRFEDLVRQLIYDFRFWKLIEATGRSGGDKGFDARMIESIFDQNYEQDENGEARKETGQHIERVWLLQCKRENKITPKKMEKYLTEFPKETIENLYGLIFVGSCNFSYKTREKFREICNKNGTQEFIIWGKAELEDMLFKPVNDHLLFAYFGISLQIRKRSMKNVLLTTLTTKRKLYGILKKYQAVLLRDPEDKRYPVFDNDAQPPRKWRSYRFDSFYSDGPMFLIKSYFACIEEDGSWDYFEDFNIAIVSNFEDRWSDKKPYQGENEIRDFWLKIDEGKRATLDVLLIIDFENIMAVDDLGDCFTERDMPHVYTLFNENGMPIGRSLTLLKKSEALRFQSDIRDPSPAKRIKIFPDVLKEDTIRT